MNVKKKVRQAVDANRTVLDEAESKSILSDYGIPVVTEAIVGSVDEAVQAATGMDGPVVLKGVGEGLLHKSDSGLVHLNLTDADAVARAARRILGHAAGTRILVQPQIRGRREWVAGLFRDPLFGPAVLFGLGGVYTEVLSDVAMRLVPLERQDAEAMLDGIRSRKLLDAFRGEAAVDREGLIRILLGLSRLAMDVPEIAEVDINPLIATPSGTLHAVDALITLARPAASDGEAESRNVSVPPASIRALFYPRSIAFVGASSRMGKWGHMLICNTISGGYQGDIYAVNPKGGIIAGNEAFPSIADIPGDVDLAVVTVPAAGVLDLIPQLAAKGIRHVVMITSGFGETGAEGQQLQQALTEAARKAGIVVLGPNTMGISNPHIDLYCTGSTVRPRAGSTAVVAQSGNMGTQLLAFAETQGIGIRAFSGSGNEAMVTIEDYLEGFEVDDKTRTVMLYIESVKQGRRFFASARRLSEKKPIVLLKGGQSREGIRAAASHTGAMATDTRLFDAVCRQAGIVNVDQPMDLLDLAAAFSSLPLPRGNRIAIMTLGGGWGVVTADLCSRFGLAVPMLPSALIKQIDGILPPYWSRANPIDLVGEIDPVLPLKVMESLLQWDACDAVINLGILGRRIFFGRLAGSIEKADPSFSAADLQNALKAFADFESDYVAQVARLMERYDKPVFGVSLLTDGHSQTVYRVDGGRYKGVFFETPERAVKAAARMVEYQQFRCRRTR